MQNKIDLRKKKNYSSERKKTIQHVAVHKTHGGCIIYIKKTENTLKEHIIDNIGCVVKPMPRALETFTNRQKHTKGRLVYYLRPLVLSTAFLHLTARGLTQKFPKYAKG